MRVLIPATMAGVTDDKNSRYALSGVHCQPTAGCGGKRCILSATDNRCLAVIDAECEGVFEPCIIPGKLFVKKTVGCWAESTDGQEWTVTVDSRKGKEIIVGATPEGRFPRIADVFPKFDDPLALKIDAKALARLAETLRSAEGDTGVTLLINRNAKTGMSDSAIGVISAAGDVGLIMPLLLDAQEHAWKHVSTIENNTKAIARSWGGKIDCDGETNGAIEPSYVSPSIEVEIPVAHVSKSVADAFDMHDIPNTVVEPDTEPEADDPLAAILDNFMAQLTA